jgi:hypothetical protein
MDDVDLIIAGMEAELRHHQAETAALADRLAAGQNGVRADLNAAIRLGSQLLTDIINLKREYGRLTQIERFRLGEFECGCGRITPGPRPSPEEALESQWETAQLAMETIELFALSDDAVELLELAWDHPRGEIESRADFCAALRGDCTEAPRGSRRSPGRWRAAVQLLEDEGLAEPAPAGFECYDLTLSGYLVAGMIHRGARPPKE